MRICFAYTGGFARQLEHQKVPPAIAPDLRYDALGCIQNGGMAMVAYLEAIHPDTAPTRKTEIENQLRAYCGLDTLAMVRLWQFLSFPEKPHN